MGDPTYFGSPVKSGSTTLSNSTDGGWMVSSQTTTLTTTSDGLAVAGTLTLPANSQIIQIFVDKIVVQVVGGGGATAIAVLVGSAAAGGEYVPSVDMVTTVRSTGVMTVATLAAMDDIGTNKTVHFTVDPNGTIVTTQAVFRFTVVYSQKT